MYLSQNLDTVRAVMVVVMAAFVGNRLAITIVACETFPSLRQVKRDKVFLWSSADFDSLILQKRNFVLR